MKKKTVLILLITAMFIFTGTATITSVDRLSFDSNTEFFTGETFVFEITSNRDTDRINLNLDNQLQEQVESGEVENTVSVEATQQQSQLKYSLRDTRNIPIYDFEPYTFETDAYAWDGVEDMNRKVRENGVAEKCFDISRDGAVTRGEDYYIQNGIGGYDFVVVNTYCVQAGNKHGEVGEIDSSPSKTYETEFTVEDAAGTHTKTLTNGEGGSGNTARFGENIVLQFTGSYGAGNTAPSPTDEMILQTNTGYDSAFTIINEDEYQTYRNQLPALSSRIEEWRSGGNSQQVVSNINDIAERAASTHSSTEFDNVQFSGNNLGDGSIILGIRNLVYPTFTGYAKACRYSGTSSCDAAVEIRRTVGKPEITDTEGADITELETGYITADFRNRGESPGSFTARVSRCGNGFSSTSASQTVELDGGESTSADFGVSFSSTSSSQKQVSAICTVEVENNMGDTASERVQVSGEQLNECIPGEQFRKVVNGRYTVFECGEDGLNTEQVKVCGENEIARQIDSEYQCISQRSTGGSSGNSDCSVEIVSGVAATQLENWDGEITNPICMMKNWFSWWYAVIAVVLGAVLIYFSAPLIKILSVLKSARN
jgi:hypothetical protein